MTKAVVIGDGPAGLSAALFLAKNGVQTTVLGKDTTAVHYAMLYNYLGIPEIAGPDFLKVAREQVRKFGAGLHEKEVVAIDYGSEGFSIATEDGVRHQADYVIIAEGKAAKLAGALGLKKNERGVEPFGSYFRTAVPKLYVVGRATDTGRSQAIISAGQGAMAAIDILSTLKGKDFRDFDELPEGG